MLPTQWRQVGQQAVVRVSSVPQSLHHHLAFRVLVYLREETDYAEKYGDEARSDDPDAARRAFVKGPAHHSHDIDHDIGGDM